MMIMKDESPNKKQNIGFICFSAALGGLLFGFDTAVISGTVDLVKHQFGMDASTEGWFVSSGLLGCIIGVFTAGLISEHLGRKKVLILSGFLFLLSGLGCTMAATTDLLVFFRLLGGVGVGVASVVAPMYITEFAPASIRGRMVAFYQLSITIGVLAAYFSNAGIVTLAAGLKSSVPGVEWLFADEIWRGMFIVMIIPSLLFILMMLMVPESPRWLSSRKASSGLQSATRSVFSRELRLPLLTGILLCVFQQFSGINAIIYYGPKIFTAAGFDGENALYAQVIIGVVNVLFTVVAIIQADKFGRKPLLAVGLSGMILSLIVVGICFQTAYLDGPLLLIMLLMFIGCFAFSVGPITWILINEIFPDDVRSKAVSICTFALWAAVWMVGQFFPWLLETVGPAFVFWIFAAFSTLNLIFCMKNLVETKGKTLEEIEDIYTSPH
jgi:SP family arabinose:H+ symporter-like MFS transporter